MKRFFGILFGWIPKLFTPEGQKKANAVAVKIQEIFPEALEAAKYIASLTPTRTDDELVRLAAQFGLPLFSSSDKLTVGNLLQNAAGIVLKQKLGRNLPDNIVNAAINTAVAVMKVNPE